jgi:molecular chaperone GrpE (heat shock protein)
MAICFARPRGHQVRNQRHLQYEQARVIEERIFAGATDVSNMQHRSRADVQQARDKLNEQFIKTLLE